MSEAGIEEIKEKSVLMQFEPFPRNEVGQLASIGRGRIDFENPKTFLNVRQKGSGKSSLLECLALKYLEKGGVAL